MSLEDASGSMAGGLHAQAEARCGRDHRSGSSEGTAIREEPHWHTKSLPQPARGTLKMAGTKSTPLPFLQGGKTLEFWLTKKCDSFLNAV